MRLLLGVGSVVLHLQEVVSLQQHKVDLFQDLVVYVDEALFAGLAFLESYKISRRKRVP